MTIPVGSSQEKFLVDPPIGDTIRFRILDYGFCLCVTQQSRPSDGVIRTGPVDITIMPVSPLEGQRLMSDGFDDHIILTLDIDPATKVWSLGVSELAPVISKESRNENQNTRSVINGGPLLP